MRLNIGDEIVCVSTMEGLTYGKTYRIEYVRNTKLTNPSDHKDIFKEDDICILCDTNRNWWFGQIGGFEPWTNWFVTKKQWDRDQKISDIID